MIEVIEPGLLTTVQDLGRPGLAHLGVPPSGAADAPSLVRANRLVGNADGAAALEATLTGPVLLFHEPAVAALTGGTVEPRLDGWPTVMDSAISVTAGSLLELGAIVAGIRTYVAVRGGIAAERVLGSRSHDLLTGLGPPPLAQGLVLTIGDAPAATLAAGPPRALSTVLRIAFGPRDDWFTETARETLLSASYEVTHSSSRVGVRLDGPPLARAREDELLSEGLVTGSLQVPPSGMPILLLPDHPTTGGYPVIAVVVAADLALAGQLRPGSTVRLVSGVGGV